MRILLLILLMLINSTIQATTYYVSSTGSDAALGTSTITAWQTISKVNSISFIAGDQILFKKGDVWYGSLAISHSGSSGNPIIYGAYGTGVNPIITGFTTISGWTNEGNGTYSKVITSAVKTNMVTIDGINVAMGRYPNVGFLSYESFSSNVSITDTSLGSSTNWNGAEAVIRKNDWTLDRCLITNHTNNTLTYTSRGSNSNGIVNYGYFIQNDLRTLDQIGEWYHNTTTGKFYMYFGAVDPTSKLVKVATINNIVDATGWVNDITFQDISFLGCIDSAIKSYEGNSNYIVNNCSISFCGQYGLYVVGASNTITNCQISDCAAIGIRGNRPGGIITNNTITSIGTIGGQSNSGANNAISIGEPNNTLVQYNVIESIGYNGIFFSDYNAGSSSIKNNFINNTCLLLNDGGGIYVGGTQPNLLIDGNIVLNSIGNISGATSGYQAEGIYLDEYGSGITVSNNTVANCSNDGIKLHKANNCVVSNNTLYNNGNGIEYLNSDGVSTITSHTLSGNIIVAKLSTQTCLLLQSYVINDTQSFGITANNNYYARPIADNTTIRSASPSNWANYMTLSTWQIFKGQDIDSKKSPKTINVESDMQFEYNATSTAKSVTINNENIDIKNAKYSTSIVLQPYTSIVLIKYSNPSFGVGTKLWNF